MHLWHSKRLLVVFVVALVFWLANCFRDRHLIVKGDGKLVDGQGTVLGASLAVTDPKSQSRALSLVGSVDWIQVQAGGTLFFVPLGRRLDLLALCTTLDRVNRGVFHVSQYLLYGVDTLLRACSALPPGTNQLARCGRGTLQMPLSRRRVFQMLLCGVFGIFRSQDNRNTIRFTCAVILLLHDGALPAGDVL